jgi:hypothetical protein
MKSYPSIPTIGTNIINSNRKLPVDITKEDWIGFDKLDGSMIRVEWKSGRGFYKFGSRNQLLDDSNPWLTEAPEIINDEFHFLDTVFRDYEWSRVVMFFEFLGKNSFAGTHIKEPHHCHLIDISLERKGLIDPKELAIMDIPVKTRVVHRGPVTPEVIHKIATRSIKGMTFEGVVFKRNSKKGVRQMFKSKSNAWYERLRQHCGKDDKLFQRLK